MNKPHILLLLVLLISTFGSGNAQAEFFSHTETILFYATGFTNSSGSLREQKQRAVQAAKYLVEKKIGLLFGIKGKTLPQTSVLPSNWSDWLKVIEISEMDSGETGKNLFGVKIFGKVAIAIPPGAALTAGNTSPAFLRVAFKSNKNIYYQGEEILFSLQGNKDFHACMLDINNKKEILQLLPNKYSPDNSFNSDTEHFFPEANAGGGFKLEVSPPYGTDMIYLVATSYPLKTILPMKIGDVFASSNKEIQTIFNTIFDDILFELKNSSKNKPYEFVQLSTQVLPLKTQNAQ